MTTGQRLAQARLDRNLSLEELSDLLQVNLSRLAAVENTDTSQLPSRIYLRDLVGAYALEVGLDPDALEASYLSELDARSIGKASDPSADDAADDSGTNEGGRPPAKAAETLSKFESGAVPKPKAPRNTPAPDVPRAKIMAPARAPAVAVRPGREDAPRPFSLVYCEPTDDLLGPLPLRQQTPIKSRLLARRRRRRILRYTSLAIAGVMAVLFSQSLSVSRYLAHVEDFADVDIDGLVSSVRDRLPRLTRAAAVIDGEMPEGARTSLSAASPAHDVSGQWQMTNRVESGNGGRFEDRTQGFELTLEQQGSRIVGQGHRSSENGERLPARRRTPIVVEGALDGGRLVLNITEHGAVETGAARVVLHLADDGSLRGRFTSDAAHAGSSVARRVRADDR